jgi:hypothetical protein
MSTIGSTAVPHVRGDRAGSVRHAPIVFGLDKFTNVLVDWTQYLAPTTASSARSSAWPTC